MITMIHRCTSRCKKVSSHDLPYDCRGQERTVQDSERFQASAVIFQKFMHKLKVFPQSKGQFGSHSQGRSNYLKLSSIFSGASRQTSQVFRRTLQLRIQDSSRDAALNLLQARHCKNLCQGKAWKLCEYNIIFRI